MQAALHGHGRSEGDTQKRSFLLDRASYTKVEVTMRSNVRRRFWFEVGPATCCGSLAVVTVFWRDWIEALTGFDPDHHNGVFEWAIVAGLLLLCFTIGAAAAAELHRPATANSAGK
jgi:hypothetical protein